MFRARRYNCTNSCLTFLFPASSKTARIENVKQLFCKIVCSLMICQWGPKHVRVDVLFYNILCNFNKIVCICWFELL